MEPEDQDFPHEAPDEDSLFGDIDDLSSLGETNEEPEDQNIPREALDDDSLIGDVGEVDLPSEIDEERKSYPSYIFAMY